MKKCNKCGIEKELSEFHKDKNSKDGHYTICISCKKVYQKNNYNYIKKVSLIKIIPGKKQCAKCSYYKEYSEFYTSNKTKDKLNCYCKQCASKIGSECYIKKHPIKIKNIETTKKCTKCGIEKEFSEFHTNSKNKIYSSCKECKNLYSRNKTIERNNKVSLIKIISGKKQCSKCTYYKDYDEFSKKNKSKDGLNSFCKQCASQKNEIYKTLPKIIITEYKCGKCSIIKNINEFTKDISKKTGHHTICTKCRMIANNEYNSKEERRIINNKLSSGYRQKNAKYNTYYNKLTTDEDSILAEDGVSLKVKCKHCRNYFIPSSGQVRRRIQALNGTMEGESHLYCSQECKDKCLIYNTKPNHYLVIKDNDDLPYTQYELEIWAETVKAKFNYICERCGEVATDAHHIKPKKLFPNEALDPDNGVAYCHSCHMAYGHSGECSTGHLANVVCTYNNSSTNSSTISTASTDTTESSIEFSSTNSSIASTDTTEPFNDSTEPIKPTERIQ